MVILPSAICRFTMTPIKLPMAFFRARTKNLQFTWKLKRPRTAKTVLRKKNGIGGISPPDIRLYYKAIVIEKVWYWHKNRNVDEWNKIENTEISPYIYGYLIFDKGSKNIQQGKRQLLQKVVLRRHNSKM